MASSGFRDLTRLASTDPAMSHGIWRTNREALIHWVDRMIAELARYRDLLKDAQDERLLEAFAEAQMQRQEFLRNPPRRQPIDTRPEIDARHTLAKMLLGGVVADNMKRAMALPDQMAKAAAERATAIGEEAPKRKSTFAERVEEGVRRDLEKLRAKDDEAPGENGNERRDDA
jgi:hypothetical protein